MNAIVHSRAWLLLGWSMIHFLWVGAALLVAAGVLRLLLRRAAPSVRYAMAVATLAILAAAPLLVAIRLAPRSLTELETLPSDVSRALVDVPYQPVRATNDTDRQLAAQTLAAAPVEPGADVVAIEALTRRAGRMGAAYLPWLWLAGFPIAALYLLAGISGTGRLRRRARLATEPALLATLDRLAAELGVRGQIVIGLSAQVVAPLVVGIARPMILLPPVLLAGWSPEELELILLHELAHVRRWDNLVNLFQRVVEAVLFFHPAVWIVSRWVRLEREQCCDEIVLRHRDAPQKYAETLAALAVPGISPVHAAAAMANHQLVARIRNILNVEDRTMRFSARSLLVAVGSIALLVGLTFVAGPLVADEQSPAKPPAPSPDKVNDQKPTSQYEKFLVDVEADGREAGAQRDVFWVLKEAGLQAANGQKRPWGPEQACGAPDTPQPGDVPSAWASASPDGQREWLEVDFGEQIDGVALVVYENNAPGAVDKLVLLDAKGNVIEVRGVKDPTPISAPSGVSIFPLVGSMHGVRVEIDSANVPGWNEIDAVGLLDKQGQVHWAKTAKASSTFADAAGYNAVALEQPYAVYAGDPVRLRAMTFTAVGDVAVANDFANDPEIARLRKSIEEIEQGLRGIAITGDAAQQELAKKRIRRAELRKNLLNEELEERIAQLRQQREAAMAQYKQATEVEQQTRVEAERALAAEQAARANAAKAEADRAQAEAQLQAAADANRKLQNELDALKQQAAAQRALAEQADQRRERIKVDDLAAMKEQAAAQKALAEQANQRRERIKLYDYYQKLDDGRSSVRLDAQALANAKQSLGIVADKLGAELKALDRQAQGASNTGRAQIAERMQKLHDQLDGIQSTLQQLDKSLQEETVRSTPRRESVESTAARQDRAELERIEQLEKAVQELRRAQQNKQNLPAVPGTPREY